ncbi:MAG: TetR/AcrR family transcriptional regulator [Halorhodospira sp.]
MRHDSGLTEAGERIIAAAKQLFARHGYSSVSIRDIAETAGVSKANVLHHFASKEELYLAVLRRCCDSARALLQAFEADARDRDPEEHLRSFIHEDLHRALADLDGIRLVLAEAFDATPSRARALVEQVFGTDFQRFTEIFASGQRRGAWRGDIDPAFVATLMVAANTFFITHREVLRQLPGVGFADDPDGYAERLVEVLLDGIRKEA